MDSQFLRLIPSLTESGLQARCWRPVYLWSLLILFSLAATAQGVRDCGDTALGSYRWVASGQNTRANNCQGSTGFRCYPVQTQGSSLEKLNPACDATAGSCAVKIHATATILGLRDMINEDGLLSSITPWAEWYPCTGAGCSKDITCGLDAFGGRINFDNLDTWLERGLTCAQALTLNLSVKIRVCATSGCESSVVINLPSADLAQSLGCPQPPPPPPPDDCATNTNQCRDCRPAGGGCSFSAEGKMSCEFGGHGAAVRYRAGGAGGDTFPGTPAWRTALGLYISHAYAQRIVTDPDLNHVWLITEGASFREFRNPAAGTGLRLYDPSLTVPSDEYRKLYFDTATGGWQLNSLNGRKDVFRPDGLWEKTVLAQNPTHPTLATYNGSNQLTAVAFPDGRSETFTYAGGKLASITEVPVSGSGTSSRTWNYLWSGDVLTNIGRPDGSSWELTYDPAKNGGRPGYLTQLRLIGTDGVTGRIEAAFEYDSFGNVIKSWSGDPAYTGPNAVSRQELTYTNPQLATRTDLLEWINGTQSQVTTYEYDRDPRSLKPRINKITGDCPVCGTGPNSQLTYGDAANPLRPTQITDGRGLKTQFGYDANGKMTSKTEAVGTPLARTTTWQYGNSSFPALSTRIEVPSTAGGSAQRVTVLSYDASGNPSTRTIQGAEAGSSFNFSTVTTFNGSGQPLTTDPPGYGTADQIVYTYDSGSGLLPATRTDPLIGTTTFGYDGLNRRTSVTDPNTLQTLTSFDNLNRVTTVTQKGAAPAEDLMTTYQYNVFGNLFRTILPRGNLIEYGYDPAGRLVSIERKPDAATHGERTFYTLDTFGHRTKEELQHWNGTAWVTDNFTDFVYSSRCHLDKTVNADGTATEYAYDCDGNLEKTWDANHPKVTNPTPTQLYAYDSLNRLTSTTQPWIGGGGTTAVTAYIYDVQDHLAGVTDAEGNTTTYTYSDRALMTQAVSPVSGTSTSSYNEHGELVGQIDARGVSVARTVDAMDRMTLIDYADNALDTANTYDDPGVQFSKGRLTKIARGASVIDYTYDRFGRMTRDGTLSYQYDKSGNRTRINYPGGVTAIYTYDFADRYATLSYDSGTGPQSLVTASAYKPFGPLSSLSFANGLTETRLFDNRYRPDRIQAGSLLDWDYTEDAVGNPTQITGTIVGQPYTATFAYQDPQYFLTQGNGPWGTRAWTYDRIGNRLTNQETGELTQAYTYAGSGHNPKLTQIAPAPGHGAGTLQFAYDAAGNQTSVNETDGEGNVEATFLDASQESRLSTLRPTTAPGRTDMLYDGRGFLRQANLTFTGSPEYVKVTPDYSSEGLLMARTEERAWSGSTLGPDGEDSIWLASNQETTQLFYFAGHPVAQLTTGPELLYLTTDHLGTPVLATNTSGAAAWAGGLEPFGRIWTAGSNPDPEPFSSSIFHGEAQSHGKALSRLSAESIFLRYPGQWGSDAFRVGGVSLDLNYNVHRWYDTKSGRYSRPDPITLGILESAARPQDLPLDSMRAYDLAMFRTGNPIHEAPYLYAAQKPLVYTDPVGLFGPGELATTGGACIAVDGPLPIGDIVGVPLLIGAAIWMTSEVIDDWWDNSDKCEECEREERDQYCYPQYLDDIKECEQRHPSDARLRQACFGQAALRYASCLGDRPLPPLSP